jgi:SAM-dependent methyltransferase
MVCGNPPGTTYRLRQLGLGFLGDGALCTKNTVPTLTASRFLQRPHRRKSIRPPSAPDWMEAGSMLSDEQVDEVFDDEFLASLYDYFNPWTPSDNFYFNMTKEIDGCVLDLGCGTGMLACRIASIGLSVTGVDPAKGMLRAAMSRDGGDRVNWIRGDGRNLRLI